ncbi:MAG: SLC13 family permease, partial [Pseudomonadota bacterium]
EQTPLPHFDRIHQLVMKTRLERFVDMLNPVRAGIGEIVIPPRSSLAGKTLRKIRFRKNYGLSVLSVYRGEHSLELDFDEVRLQSGDTIVVHSLWDNFVDIGQNPDFVLITRDFPNEKVRPEKMPWALGFFMLALGLILFTEVPLSVALFTGAIGMILTRVLNIDEAYRAISWQTVFLLASLIPLGIAMEKTSTAAWVAQNTVALLGDLPVWVLQTGIAVLATGFTLVMSNVGATVLLVPLAINVAIVVGADPRVFAITVALATSNSFIIPTHQVNALLMGPGGYQVRDYMRAGGIMTILFLIVLIPMLNLVF